MLLTNTQVVRVYNALNNILAKKTLAWSPATQSALALEPHLKTIHKMNTEAVERFNGILETHPDGTPKKIDFAGSVENKKAFDAWDAEFAEEKINVDLKTLPASILEKESHGIDMLELSRVGLIDYTT